MMRTYGPVVDAERRLTVADHNHAVRLMATALAWLRANAADDDEEDEGHMT